MPMMTRLAPVTKINDETRTVELVWTSGAGVMRYDWYAERYYLEELSLDPSHVRMGRLQSGRAPLLNTHSRWDLSSVMGVVRSAALEGQEGTAIVEFSKRENVEPYYQDVKDTIIGNVSVGYTVYEYERIAPANKGEPWIYRAIDWEPTEISLVPIGADAEAGIRSDDPNQRPKMPEGRTYPCKFTTRGLAETLPPAAAGNLSRKENTMSGENTQSAAPINAASQVDQVALDAARAEGARMEAERQAGIREAVSLGGLDATYADQLIARSDMTPADAGLAVLREKAKRDAATPTRSAADIETVTDETDVRRAAIADAIALRCNPNADVKRDPARLGAARQYRGHTLVDLARECIEAAGGSARGMSRREIAMVALNLDSDMRARAGLSSSDFPQILGNTVSRTLRQAYQVQQRTFVGWARQSTAPDFKEVARTQLSESAQMKQIREGGEYKALTFGEGAEKFALSKFGGIVTINWEAIVNDDLSAFDRIPAALAAEAAAIESDIVYGILTGNPKMSDNVALFHSTHANLAGSGAALDDTTLGEGRAGMRKQKGMKGRILNLTPSFLIVGPDNETAANKYTSASFVAAKAGDINPNFNTSLEVVVEGRITDKSFFLAATPAQVDTVEYMYLEGEEGLYTEQRVGFEVDGLQIKARHTFAAKAIDWRGLWKNPGV